MMDRLSSRLRMVTIVLLVLGSILIVQLLSFQFRLDPEVANRLRSRAVAFEGQEVEFHPNRGQIFDRDGQVLAVNTLEYRVGISPGAIGSEKREVATQLARALDMNELEVYQLLLPDENGQYPSYITIKSPVTLAQGEAVVELDIPGMVIESIPLREYPQGELTANVVGFVNYDGRGFWGVEEHYNAELAGQSKIGVTSDIPLEVSEGLELRPGQDIWLTIDRDVQFIAQEVLEKAINTYSADGGQILVMDPRTGEILAMASYPFMTPEEYNQLPEDDRPIYNGAISYQFEPGSIFKIVTASVALDIQEPGLDLNWTYVDPGCETRAGVQICTSTRRALGSRSFAQCIIQSLNTCTAEWNSIIGTSRWYDYLHRFNFGGRLGIDLAGEAPGQVNWMGSPAWNEANFLQSSFGQGIAVTPLQMLTAANAIANDGRMMQPHIVLRRTDGDYVFESRPTTIDVPISATTAQTVRELMVQAVYHPEGFGSDAAVEGYTIAGKTGTAQKLDPDFGYSDFKSWASFIGFVPADDPQLSVLIMLDGLDVREGYYWGSETATFVFAELVERLVVLLEIPPDAERQDLVNAGGHPFERE
ncbi:MAG: penicillin-binding protein 2 [Chloroflexi bacterium]|nr:penicillin-binding protein 2 [Chloroflexota bacterium]